MSDDVRKLYKTIAFDLLIGQPGQTIKTMEKTCDQIIQLKPTLVQTSLMAYKPWVNKAAIRMVEDGPLPDFIERKDLLDVIDKKLKDAGYLRVAFESYALPSDNMVKELKKKNVHYAAAGTQTGGRVNFIGVGTSTKGNLGDDYYHQNHYDLKAYKKCLDNNIFPIFRGMKLSRDDKIRQHATQQLRTYWEINFEDFKQRFDIDCKQYFKKEIHDLQEMEKDGLIKINNESIIITELGKDFSQFITNYFDAYDPPSKSYAERLAVIKKAKEDQNKFLKFVDSL